MGRIRVLTRVEELPVWGHYKTRSPNRYQLIQLAKARRGVIRRDKVREAIRKELDK